MRANLISGINLLAEFADNQLEKEYKESEFQALKRYVRPIVLFLGIIYTLFIVPDYFFVKDTHAFQSILAGRIIFLFLVLILFHWIKSIQKHTTLFTVVTIYEIMASLLFIHVFYQYQSPELLIQTFGIILIILAIFLVPNRWINSVFASLFIAVAFFISAVYYLDHIEQSHFYAAMTYIILITVVSGIASFRTNTYKRNNFLKSKDLINLSTKDPLTQVYNRLKFDDELDNWIAYANRYSCHLSLAIFDIDSFKKVNDDNGHLTGDKVLKEITGLVKSMIRETDIFARWGGEEFVILFPNTDREEALEITERIRKKISGHDFASGHITCSFGVDTWYQGEERDSLIQRVDTLLRRAKETGKNKVQYELVPC
ncbi:GGDEF domain-containing protein [Dehalobacter sp. DCM]|uniref:GGDEF domain-containing protein n=1 Tax=Dehalobacter sp. DCM TaxID=2907827 RepID=UPI00308170CB|nr:GGDEF domain-containing protein [Dehalobacter sp. DCM]